MVDQDRNYYRDLDERGQQLDNGLSAEFQYIGSIG
jgi:hypothetical protein